METDLRGLSSYRLSQVGEGGSDLQIWVHLRCLATWKCRGSHGTFRYSWEKKKTADLKPSNDVTGRAWRCGPTAVEMIGYEIAQLSRPLAASSSD